MTDMIPAFEVPPHAEPRRPWRRTGRTVLLNGGVVVVSGVLGATIVALTGLAGALGWFVATILVLPPIAGAVEMKRGMRAVTSRIVGASVLMMFTSVALPWVSIIWTVIKIGRAHV